MQDTYTTRPLTRRLRFVQKPLELLGEWILQLFVIRRDLSAQASTRCDVCPPEIPV